MDVLKYFGISIEGGLEYSGILQISGISVKVMEYFGICTDL